jgi:hypothetical protein
MHSTYSTKMAGLTNNHNPSPDYAVHNLGNAKKDMLIQKQVEVARICFCYLHHYSLIQHGSVKPCSGKRNAYGSRLVEDAFLGKNFQAAGPSAVE